MDEPVCVKEPCCPFFTGASRSDHRCGGKPGEQLRAGEMQTFCCDVTGWKKCPFARKKLLEEEEAEEMDAEERERLNAKIQAQNREIKELRKKLADAELGLKQISKSVDSILAVACRELGEATPDDQWELRLPEVDIQKTLKRYAVSARKEPESGGYIIRCARRK